MRSNNPIFNSNAVFLSPKKLFKSLFFIHCWYSLCICMGSRNFFLFSTIKKLHTDLTWLRLKESYMGEVIEKLKRDSKKIKYIQFIKVEQHYKKKYKQQQWLLRCNLSSFPFSLCLHSLGVSNAIHFSFYASASLIIISRIFLSSGIVARYLVLFQLSARDYNKNNNNSGCFLLILNRTLSHLLFI